MSLFEVFDEMELSKGERAARERWLRIKEARGHARAFARETPEDLAIVERSTAKEWAKSVRDRFGLNVSGIVSNLEATGVPDCFGRLDGNAIGIELTELVDGQLIDDIRMGAISSAHTGNGFFRSQWDVARFAAFLIAAIEKKHAKYQRNGERVDVLILHSDETWLDPFNVDRWLRWRLPGPGPCIGSAYFLLTYHPGYSQNWPVFRLF